MIWVLILTVVFLVALPAVQWASERRDWNGGVCRCGAEWIDDTGHPGSEAGVFWACRCPVCPRTIHGTWFQPPR